MPQSSPEFAVCFVCLGNICRSPTAEGIFAHLLENAGLKGRVEVDSAGTGAWHKGEPADRRARAEARKHGVSLDSVARQVLIADFDRFDLLVAMDGENLSALQQLAPSEAAKEKLTLLRDFDPISSPGAEVPDPYYGGVDGFADVFSICRAACEGLLRHLRRHTPLR